MHRPSPLRPARRHGGRDIKAICSERVVVREKGAVLEGEDIRVHFIASVRI